MNILVACEESQRVCTAFREKGHRAFSCDILPPSGGHPEWAIQMDVLELIDGDCEFITVEGGGKSHLRTLGSDHRPSSVHVPDERCDSASQPDAHLA